MEKKSSVWGGESKNIYLIIFAFLVVQNHLKTSLIFSEATSNVSAYFAELSLRHFLSFCLDEF